MALIQAEIFSDAVGMCMPFNAIIPENKTPDTPVLYLLHGLSDDHTMWCRRTSIERYAEEKGLIVIMPTTHRGFYTDMAHGMKYYTYIAEELPKKIKNLFNIDPPRSKTFVAGLSMGGYGALKFALREPERFCAVGAMSSVTDMASRQPFNPMLSDIFGDELKPEDDLYKLAEKNKNNLPRIYITCGTEDGLLEMNRNFDRYLTGLGVEHTYLEYPGTHNWAYWDARIKEILDWFGL